MRKINRVVPQEKYQKTLHSHLHKTEIPNLQENSAVAIHPQHAKYHMRQNNINPASQEHVDRNVYSCRICLQEGIPLHAKDQDQLITLLQKLEEDSKINQPKYLITTCKCQGTTGYVHQRCTIQWIDTQYKRLKEQQMKCEICLGEILYERKMIAYLQFNIKDFKNVSSCNFFCFAVIITLLACFSFFGIQSDTLSLNYLTKVTIFIIITILGVAFGLITFIIGKQAFFKKKRETVKVYTNDQVEICGILKDNLTCYERKTTSHRTQTNLRSMRTIRSPLSMVNVERQRRVLSQQAEGQLQQTPIQHQVEVNGVFLNEQRQRSIALRSQRSIRRKRDHQNIDSIRFRSMQRIYWYINRN